MGISMRLPESDLDRNLAGSEPVAAGWVLLPTGANRTLSKSKLPPARLQYVVTGPMGNHNITTDSQT